MRILAFHGAVVVAFFLVFPTDVRSAIMAVAAEDTGFYNSVGRHSKLDGSPSFGGATPATFNYSTGTIDEGPPFGPPGLPPDVFRKNYFTFDLSGLSSGEITAASLKVLLPIGGYSGAPSLTYKLYGSIVPGSPAMTALSSDLKGVYSPFVPAELTAAMGLFSKIGDTKLAAIPAFGSVTVTIADEGSVLSIPLTPPGLAYLNLYAGGDVVMGGELDGLTTTGPPDDPAVFLFGFSSPVIAGVVPWDMSSVTPSPTPLLELTIVPEPSSAMLLLVLGLVPLARLRRMTEASADLTNGLSKSVLVLNER